MTVRIQRLPEEVVHQISAGEVIDSLAAAVRELVENALDAGATRLTIAVWPDSWRVRVGDNGCGFSLANLHQAAIAHSTSKICHRDHLLNITSLGFRGEALHSLAQLGTLEICSREPQSPEGWQVCYDQSGKPSAIKPVAIAPGTVVTVSDLFANWISRRQALPTVAQQLRAIQTTLQHMALCHPQVTWQVQHSDRNWFGLWPGETALQILPQILRNLQPGDLQSLSLVVPTPNAPDLAAIQGVLGLPDRCHRHRPDWIRLAVNQRMIRSPELEQTILGAFRRLLPRDRFPVCFLHLQVPAYEIDWNRHPAKIEIYLHHLAYWQEQITQAIAQALSFQTPLNTLQTQRVTTLLKVAEAEAGYSVHRQVEAAAPQGNPAELSPLPLLKAVAQVRNTYILAEHPGGAVVGRATHCPRTGALRTTLRSLAIGCPAHSPDVESSFPGSVGTVATFGHGGRTLWHPPVGGAAGTRITGSTAGL